MDTQKLRYKHNEWDFSDGDEIRQWAERTYIDMDGNPITGILEGFYGYTTNTKDERNCQYVEKGKIVYNN